MKIEEINTINEEKDGGFLFTSIFDRAHMVATKNLIQNYLIIDLKASFHVTPKREWCTTYGVAQRG